MCWYKSVKICFYVFWSPSVSMRDGEGTGDCGSGAFTAEKADGVEGKDQQISQYFAVFGSHNYKLNGSITR